jgi:hypothetical protein
MLQIEAQHKHTWKRNPTYHHKNLEDIATIILKTRILKEKLQGCDI